MEIPLYRQEDLTAVSEKIDEIMEFSEKKAQKVLVPTYNEYLIVFKIISDFIKRHQRIVYGGIALNEMLKEKSPKDVFYKEGSVNDIEIYSPDPVTDLMNICNMLYQKKFEFIEGKEADHPGTFTIFVNFEKYCDITYVPKVIYHNLPTVNVNGYKCIHPIFILTDTLRVYTDPLTSYFRLNKTFDRTNLLLKVANFKPQKGNIKEDDSYMSLLNVIVPKLVNIKNIIFTDDPAYNYYIEQDENKKLKESHIGVIIPDIKRNAQKVYNVFLDAVAEKDNDFREHVEVKEYNTFFQFWDRRIEIIYKKKKIITIYENSLKCYQFKEIDRYNTKIKISNFTLTLLYNLIYYNYNAIFNLDFKVSENKIANLLFAKNNYLTKNKLTILDDSPFREFEIECLGETISFRRKTRLRMQERKDKNMAIVYRYIPSADNNNLKKDYKFYNESGSLITNDNNKVIKL